MSLLGYAIFCPTWTLLRISELLICDRTRPQQQIEPWKVVGCCPQCKTARLQDMTHQTERRWRRWCPGAYIYAAAVGCWWTYLSSNGHELRQKFTFELVFVFQKWYQYCKYHIQFGSMGMVWNGYLIGNANYYRRFQGKWHWQSIQFIAFFNPSMPGTQWPRVFGTCTATFLRSGWKSLVFHLFRRFWTDFFQKNHSIFQLGTLLYPDLWFMAFALEGLSWHGCGASEGLKRFKLFKLVTTRQKQRIKKSCAFLLCSMF